MNKKWIQIAALISIGILISSCDKEHIKEYSIQNDSIEELIVSFTVNDIIDSTVVDAKETTLIYSDIYYFGTVGVSDERYEDKISDVKIQRDSITTELDESLWEYDEVDKYFAKYTMVVN